MAQESDSGRVSIKLGEISWKRSNSQEPNIELVNRYYEENPTNQIDQVALLTRPALTSLLLIGEGPVREMYYEDGCFDNDLWVVTGEGLYRIAAATGVVTQITGAVIGGTARPSMAATKDPFLFVADSTGLGVYDGALDTYAAVATPDDVGIVSLAYIAGFVICVVTGSQRFYWIRPGTKVIDPLDFAEAERFPDWLIQAMPLGDQFALFGRKTTEFWYPTGDSLAPFAKLQGRMYDKGVWSGTATKVGDAILLVGNDGVVYSVEGGPQRISYYALEEKIRRAMIAQES